ncbi:MAG: STAS domain-containing protein [Polaromonas sp.]|nr:STAS domain-containing protein [Polaromonas sp.]
MAKEEAAPGLLSKMVKFVRNPTTNWSDLDTAQGDRDDAMSKQLLKDMIERKRRNDFVRKREFDMLRKMRQREVAGGVGGEDGDAAGKPSFFQSSLPSTPGDRATTLKKIDEIETQMALQWWKNKNGQSPDSSLRGALGIEEAQTAQTAQTALPPAPGTPGWTPPRDQPVPIAYRPTEPFTIEAHRVVATEAAALLSPPQFPKMSPRAEGPKAQAKASFQESQVTSTKTAGSRGVNYEAASDFSASKFTAVEVGGKLSHDTEVEEAAILFANGDDVGAETGLLDLLAPGGARIDHAETWLTLFDLYRATSQQEKFESAAIGFVERFSRSAPQWFSMPEMIKLLVQPAVRNGNSPLADWICPSVMGMQTVAALKAALAKAAMPWRLDWRNLKTIESAAVDPLIKIFSGWSASDSQVRFIGDAQLQRVLQEGTPSGDRSTEKGRWQLRMEALRVTQKPDDFEMAALDFCVTFEISPPSWESSRCKYLAIDASGGPVGGESAFVGEIYGDSLLSRLPGDSQYSQFDSVQGGVTVVAVELSGQIQGDAIAVLDTLNQKLSRADEMHIDCTRLIRVDFSSAGTLLNWVSARQSEGRPVRFTKVNRLVAAFFNVIGISAHSEIFIGTD